MLLHGLVQGKTGPMDGCTCTCTYSDMLDLSFGVHFLLDVSFFPLSSSPQMAMLQFISSGLPTVSMSLAIASYVPAHYQYIYNAHVNQLCVYSVGVYAGSSAVYYPLRPPHRGSGWSIC